MLKRSMLIGMLCASLVALFSTQSIAYTFKSGAGWGYKNPYTIHYIIAGGQQPGTETTFVGSEIQILDACLVCRNPGTNQLDVRGGLGGTTIFTYGVLEDQQYDERGRINFEQILCATVDPDNPIPEYQCDLQEFRNLWNEGEPLMCRNSNWEEYQYLVTRLILMGTIYTNCVGAPTPENCDTDDEISYYCQTDESCRAEWPGTDGEVRYICVPEGSPIAWDDPNYSVRKNRTLNVRAPGVRENDSDAEGDSLTVSLVSDVSSGALDLHADGSFTYTPVTNFVGQDTFTYIANDGAHNSNEATVTITVY